MSSGLGSQASVEERVRVRLDEIKDRADRQQRRIYAEYKEETDEAQRRFDRKLVEAEEEKLSASKQLTMRISSS